MTFAPHLYVASCTTGVKIGRSSNPEARVKTLTGTIRCHNRDGGVGMKLESVFRNRGHLEKDVVWGMRKVYGDGPGGEWFEAQGCSMASVLRTVGRYVHRCDRIRARAPKHITKSRGVAKAPRLRRFRGARRAPVATKRFVP
uniref:Uncharacterized protein n=1 Tax=viral metagenome TaxID=1070528 RepID=A0A6C0KEB2_9ZZZZ